MSWLKFAENPEAASSLFDSRNLAKLHLSFIPTPVLLTVSTIANIPHSSVDSRDFKHPDLASRRTHGNYTADLMKVSAATAVLGALSHVSEAFDDSLPSWNNGAAKTAILDFVRETTEKSSSKYVEPKDRIATFDQDGLLPPRLPVLTAHFTDLAY